MGLYPLTEEADIEEMFGELGLLATGGEELHRSLNFFRNDGPTDLYWHTKEKVWFHLGNYENRWSIICGNDNPHTHFDTVEIICTFNVPFKGINRRCAGIFLQDDNDRIYLGHNGSFPNFHKSVAEKELSGWEPITWPDDKTSSVIVVAELFSDDFIVNVGKFVQQVKEYKDRNR